MSRVGSALKRARRWVAGRWRYLTGKWKPLVEKPVLFDELLLVMEQASLPYFGFYFMLALATAIATFGLLSNSAATIIGAMIISPLMYPIMSLSFGILVNRRKLLIRSLVTLVTGIALVVMITFASTSLLGLRVAGSEILSRTDPTLLDLGVALAAGGASAFAYTRRSVFSAIAGVAIAVALVPPLAVVGIGLALDREFSADQSFLDFSELVQYSGVADVSLGALTLFLTNLSGIIIVASTVFLFNGYGQWKSSLPGLLLVTVVATLLTWPLGVSLREMYVKSELLSTIATLVAENTALYPGTSKLETVDVRYIDGIPNVRIDVLVPEKEVPRVESRVKELGQRLNARVGEQVILRAHVIPITILEYVYPPRAADISQEAGDATNSNPEEKEVRDPGQAQ